MTRGGVKVFVGANFEQNLESIRGFLATADASFAFDALVERLAGHLIPTLERYPEIGAEFMGRAPLSVEGRALFQRVAALAGGDGVRQLIDGDYIVLYLMRGTSLYLLSIRHQRQLSFDFSGHWP